MLGAGKLADCGKTADVGTNLLESPIEETYIRVSHNWQEMITQYTDEPRAQPWHLPVDVLLKGLLGEREGWVLAVEVNGLENAEDGKREGEC